jgi:hypothetical protein
VTDLDAYRWREAAGSGLVLGYGNLADGQVDEAVALLARILLARILEESRSPQQGAT